MLWHHRLGHPSFSYLKRLFPSLFDNKILVFLLVRFVNWPDIPGYLFNTNLINLTPFSLIHSDIWGPSAITTSFGKRWFITFIDDHTRATWANLLHNKSDANKTFQTFHQMVQTQFQARIQILRTDNGKEYFNNVIEEYLSHHGIIHQSVALILHNKMGYQNTKIVIY